MSSATLRFKLPEEQEEFRAATLGGAYAGAIDDVSNQVFRPARKHGYADITIQALIQKINARFSDTKDAEHGCPESPAEELIGALESLYIGILDSAGLLE